MSVTQELFIYCQVWCVHKIGMRIPFSKEDMYVTNYLHLYVYSLLNFVFTVTLMLFNIYLNVVNAYISWNTAFAAIVSFNQISTSPMVLILS